jgi:muramidase (phage lysozyme)
MLRAAVFFVALAGLALAFRARDGSSLADLFGGGMSANVRAFLALIRQVEPSPPGDYTSIAGGDHFSDFSEHPFVLEPDRVKKLGTTASGAYQMVKKTWAYARDALELSDFSPASQDAAAAWLLQYKVPGQNIIEPGGTGNIELIEAGDFRAALAAYAPEWEALQKMLQGRYPVTLDQAQAIYSDAGGQVA